MSELGSRLVVFSDIDATLIDHETYELGPARAAVRRLQNARVPLVLCSSKTRAEQRQLRADIDLRDPFVVENGSAVLELPTLIDPLERETVVLGEQVDEIVAAVRRVAREIGADVRGFSTCTAAEVREATGLAIEDAVLATQREYSETIISVRPPGLMVGLRGRLEYLGFATHEGGRFVSVVGAHASKGHAVGVVAARYQKLGDGHHLTTVAVGDSANDLPMLAAVDLPFLVRRHDGDWLDTDLPNIRRLSGIGPFGFAEMVDEVVESIRGYEQFWAVPPQWPVSPVVQSQAGSV